MTAATLRRQRALPACWLCMLLVTDSGVAAMAATDEPPPSASFDEQTLSRLLTEIRTLHEVLTRGIDASASAIVERLPGLRYRLEALERRIQRQLPLLREDLRRLERALRDAVPAEQRAPPPLIEVRSRGLDFFRAPWSPCLRIRSRATSGDLRGN
jgi:hypothetical protein